MSTENKEFEYEIINENNDFVKGYHVLRYAEAFAEKNSMAVVDVLNGKKIIADFRETIEKAVDSIADAVEEAAESAAEKLGDAIKDAAMDALDKVEKKFECDCEKEDDDHGDEDDCCEENNDYHHDDKICCEKGLMRRIIRIIKRFFYKLLR